MKKRSNSESTNPTVIEVIRYRTGVFDPWHAPLEAAMFEEEDSQLPLGNPARPIFQWVSAQRVMALRESCATDGASVLECVFECAMSGLVMPDWLSQAFVNRYRAVKHFKERSWDAADAFGKPHPTGTNLKARRKERQNGIVVYSGVRTLLKAFPNRAIDKGLFEEVGAPLGLGATTAEKYYYKTKKRMEMSRPKRS